MFTVCQFDIIKGKKNRRKDKRESAKGGPLRVA